MITKSNTIKGKLEGSGVTCHREQISRPTQAERHYSHGGGGGAIVTNCGLLTLNEQREPFLFVSSGLAKALMATFGDERMPHTKVSMESGRLDCCDT